MTMKNIPGPWRMPFIGNLYSYKFGWYNAQEYHKVLHDLHEKYGPIVRTQLGPRSQTIVHLFDPDYVEAVHKIEGKMPYVKPLQATVQQYRKLKNKSPGLGNTNGEEWYRLRAAVRQLMLRPQEVQNYLPIVNEITDELISHIRIKRNKNNELKNIRHELSKWSREVAGKICFGRRMNSMDGSSGEVEAQKIIDANRQVFQLSSQLKFSLQLYKYIRTPAWNRLEAAEDVLTNHGLTLVEETIEKLRNKTDADCQFMQHLLARKDLTDRDISIIVLSVFTDGLSTTIPTLMCCLYCLAVNPSVQEEAYDEIRTALNGDAVITSSVLSRMPLLKAVVKEVLRMYPNGVETDRVLQSEQEIGGHILPPNTHVTMNQLVNFRSAKYFDNPDSFIPHRWLRTNNVSSHHNFLLLPFGYGSRSCIGRRFAEQDLYVSISKILLSYRLSVSRGPPLELIYETLLFPREPLRIQFHTRT